MSYKELLEHIHFNFKGRVVLYKVGDIHIEVVEFIFKEGSVTLNKFRTCDEDNPNDDIEMDVKVQAINESLYDTIIDGILVLLDTNEYSIEINQNQY